MTTGGLVFGGREMRVVDFEGADVVQFQVPSGISTVQASVERRLELLEPFGPDLYVESASVISPDVVYVVLQVRHFQLSFQTDAESTERRACTLQGH